MLDLFSWLKRRKPAQRLHPEIAQMAQNWTPFNCPNCGQPAARPDALFCYQCGYPFHERTTGPITEDPYPLQSPERPIFQVRRELHPQPGPDTRVHRMMHWGGISPGLNPGDDYPHE